jgi:WS/DGAT/MGAT family acyltransferase
MRSWADVLWRTSAAVYKVAVRAAETAAAVIRSTCVSSIGPATTMRRYDAVRIPLAAVDSVCRKFGVTTNDVALAAISEGFRTVLLQRGEQPRADSLRTLEKTDNRVSAMLPYLPVEHDDPVRRLRAVHNRLHQTTQDGRRQTGSLSDLTTSYRPLMLCAKAIQTLARLPQQGIVTLATNAPGPRHRLRLMGQWMDQLLPIPPTAQRLSTGVAVLSYGEELVFGITADYDAAPDMKRLAAGIESGIARLAALSEDSVLLFTKDGRKRSSRGQRRRAPRSAPGRH